MGVPLQPGELVVSRIRWQVGADLMGIVIGHDEEPLPNWLVLWTMADQRIQFKWHLADALMVIEPTNVQEVRRRCGLGS